MSNIPHIIISLLESFLEDRKKCTGGENHGHPEVTKKELGDLRDIINILIHEKWEPERVHDDTVKCILVTQPLHEPFRFEPVPRVNTSQLAPVSIDTEEFYDYVNAVENNHKIAAAEMTDLIDFIRRKSGRGLQVKEWNKMRIKGAVEDIEREREK